MLSMSLLSTDELLLACESAPLRSVSLNTGQIFAQEPIAQRDMSVWRVAFDAHTKTLLLLVYKAKDWQLVSQRRKENTWLEVQRLKTNLTRIMIYNMAVCHSRILLFASGKQTVYMFDVSAEHILRAAGNVTVQSEIIGLACTRREDDMLIAFSHPRTVVLQRLVPLPLHLELLATRDDITDPGRLLFRGDMLLIADTPFARPLAIISLRVSGNALTDRRILLEDENSIFLGDWALAGDQLLLSDFISKDLLVYDFL